MGASARELLVPFFYTFGMVRPRDSSPRPPAPKVDALPTELSRRLYITVADPGPLMLGVLDRWTPTVNVLQTLIAQIRFHIELCPIEARDSINLYTTPLSIWPSGFRDFFHFILFKIAKVPSE